MVKHLLLLAIFILLFSFCFSFLSFDFIEASFIDNIKFSEQKMEDIKYNPDNKYIYLSSPKDESVFVIDTLTNEMVKRITGVGQHPSDIVYNPITSSCMLLTELTTAQYLL